MYFVYVLYSNKGRKRYIGYTSDLKRRMHEHNRGDSDFTSRYNDWKLIYYECFLNKNDARKEELFLKTGQGRERLKYLFENYKFRLK